MDTSTDLKMLSSLGFSEKEGRVYLSLLRLGEVGASKIVKDTGLHGQFVYNSLDQLEKKGLVKHVIVKSRKRFSAQPPRAIESYIEEKKQTAITLVEQLQKEVSASDIQQFEIYQGEEAYRSSELHYIQLAKPDSEVLIIGGTGDNYENVMGDIFTKYELIRNKKNVSVKYIGSIEQKTYLSKYDVNRGDFHYRLLPGAFSGELNITIYDDRINFVMFGTPVVSFTFMNKSVADSFRSFFYVIWSLAK